MPPPLVESDDEAPTSTSRPVKSTQIPKIENGDIEMKDDDNNAKEKSGADNGAEEDEENEDEEEDDPDEANEYVVEKILEHRSDFEDNVMRYSVKWQGYEKKSDRTWETEENLSGAKDILHAYWNKIGGRPLSKKEQSAQKRRESAKQKREKIDSDTPPPKKQKRGRKSGGGAADEDEGPPGLTSVGDDEWQIPHPHPGAWDHQIDSIDTVEREENGQLWAYLVWGEKTEGGRFRRSKAKMEVVYTAAPQKMLKFYEQHLKFPDVDKPLA